MQQYDHLSYNCSGSSTLILLIKNFFISRKIFSLLEEKLFLPQRYFLSKIHCYFLKSFKMKEFFEVTNSELLNSCFSHQLFALKNMDDDEVLFSLYQLISTSCAPRHIFFHVTALIMSRFWISVLFIILELGLLSSVEIWIW